MGGMARISRRVILAAAPLLPLAPFVIRSSFGQHRGARKAQLYVGTYTHDMGPGGQADGIYLAEWDAAAGAFGPLGLAMKTANPSFLAVPPIGDVRPRPSAGLRTRFRAPRVARRGRGARAAKDPAGRR